jgi:hypothetical protein
MVIVIPGVRISQTFRSTARECERQETLVVRAFIKLEDRVDILRSREIVEDYFVWTDAHDGTVFLE